MVSVASHETVKLQSRFESLPGSKVVRVVIDQHSVRSVHAENAVSDCI